MRKFWLFEILTLISAVSFADTSESAVQEAVTTPQPNPNSIYIGQTSYIQNPYNSQNYPTTGGGTSVVSNDQMIHQNFWEKWFVDGTYNIYAGAAIGEAGNSNISNTTSTPFNKSIQPYVYGVNIFAQTGSAAGFSIGGLLSAMNPLGANHINGLSTQSGSPEYSIYTPTFSQLGIAEAYLEYRYLNTVQVDAGYIGINNSPWINANYENNLVSVPATYQGMIVNINLNDGWLLTTLAFNAAEYGGGGGFTGNTNYSITNQGISKSNGYASSNGTIALGANYTSNDSNYNLRLWGYQFDDYGTMLYTDTSITLLINKEMSFNISAQLGTDQQWLQGTNSITQLTGNNIQSYMGGVKANWTYNWFQLNLSANSMWGPNGSYKGGVFVSPYTVGQSVDPTYSNGWSTNMVSNGFAGNEYKLGTQFGFLNNNLTIMPAYIYATSGNQQFDGIQELDLIANYAIPQVRGLFLFGVFANQWMPEQNPNGANAWTSQLGVFYAY